MNRRLVLLNLPFLRTKDPRATLGDVSLRARLTDVLAAQQRYSQVVDGRFKGGYITRQYGDPAAGVHAVQLEMAWRCYMVEAPPYAWRDERAAEITPLLRRLVDVMIAWRP